MVTPAPWASGPRHRQPPPCQPSWLFPFPTTQTSCGSPGAVERTTVHDGAVGGPADARPTTGSRATRAASPRTRHAAPNLVNRFAFIFHLPRAIETSRTPPGAGPTGATTGGAPRPVPDTYPALPLTVDAITAIVGFAAGE